MRLAASLMAFGILGGQQETVGFPDPDVHERAAEGAHLR